MYVDVHVMCWGYECYVLVRWGLILRKKSCKNHTYERDRKEREVVFLY